MSALFRTEYRDVNEGGVVRDDYTGHGESLTDMENYLLAVERLRNSSLHAWGVADGLMVTATTGGPDLKISPGVALDRHGNLIALTTRGVAIVDPTVDPQEVRFIPTVTVPVDGLALSTAGMSGDWVLTLTWREVLGTDDSSHTLMHAPWVRLQPMPGFDDVGDHVVLAAVSTDAAGAVTAINAGPCRSTELRAGRVELRAPRTHAGGETTVEQAAAAEILARPDGGVDLNLLSTGTPRKTLSVEASTGDVQVASGLQVHGTTGSRPYRVSAAKDGLHITDLTSQTDQLVIDPSGTGTTTVNGDLTGTGTATVAAANVTGAANLGAATIAGALTAGPANCRAICLIGIRSATCSRRISAQSSTLNIPSVLLARSGGARIGGGGQISSDVRGQFSRVADTVLALGGSVHALVLRPRGAHWRLAVAPPAVLPSALSTAWAPRSSHFVAQ